ncbi:MAG: hypothetical protein PHP70_06165 [Gallionella sp.]|nr:hypothetical protein [Gallionella sp.]
MEKTVKIRAYSGDTKSDAAQGNAADAQNKSLELAMKDAQIEEEKSRALEHLKTIVQLRESLKQEQAKTAEMAKRMAEHDAKLKELAGLDANALAKKNALLEEEQKKSLEHLQTIAQLRESLKQEQAKSPEMVNKMAVLEARVTELLGLETKLKELSGLENKAREAVMLEAKVRELTEALGKIAAIAAAGKAG